ncbi:F-box protein At3g12350-like [Henckelia pumila]|uniref:F-box protein At3g12350-like n=1 Tax=Henckelia pumila TaxID=405737 RepID=UPI003C6E4F45
MESDLVQLSSFSDLPEDAQLRVLSFVSRPNLKAFACTSKKFSALCTNDDRLWLLKCTRRWGSRTQITKWGGGNIISYKALFNLLKDYETLIRFWIYINESKELMPLSSPPLLLFEWCSFYITGYRVSPSKDGGYGVIKTPFIWITATCDGEGLVYLDTSNGTVSLTEEDLLREDSEKLRTTELIIAEVDTQKYNVLLTIGENQDFSDFRRQLSDAEEYENVYRSPPDELMTQIREAVLTNTIPEDYEYYSSKKLNSRQRRRRRRAEEQMASALQWETSYFLQLHKRYYNYSHSDPYQPLQGLWKGIGRNKSLNFYIVTYTIYMGEFSCKMAGSSVTSQITDGLVFSALMKPYIEPPFSSKERHMYDYRLHLRPAAGYHDDQPDPTSSDVVRIYYANMGPESRPPEEIGQAGGRIWQYADGSFGFGSLKDHYIIHLKPMVLEDDTHQLLDLISMGD